MDVSTLERHALAMLRKPLTLKDALLEVSDFRIDRRKKYPLYEMLMIAVCAMVAGAKGPTDFERFGTAKLKFLKKFLPLQNGIPSHDTFRRVLGKLDPKRFNAALVKWLESVSDVAGDIISVDGKLLRRALTKDGKMPCIVSAYSKRTKLVIGQVKADEKSNEITAIPNLLDVLYLKGAIVTIDAAGCQKKIVGKILKRGAGYIISLKGNQSTMHDEIRAFMQDPAFKARFKKAKAVDNGHGRKEFLMRWPYPQVRVFRGRIPSTAQRVSGSFSGLPFLIKSEGFSDMRRENSSSRDTASAASRSMASILARWLSRRPSALPASFAADSAMICRFVHTETRSILFIWLITRVAVSERLSIKDGAGGIRGWRGFHATLAAGGGLSRMLNSMCERPVMPLETTVPLSPRAIMSSSLRAVTSLSAICLTPSFRRFMARRILMRWESDMTNDSGVCSPSRTMSLTSPILTPLKLTSLPGASPLTGLS